jgi:hypothetical protein
MRADDVHGWALARGLRESSALSRSNRAASRTEAQPAGGPARDGLSSVRPLCTLS